MRDWIKRIIETLQRLRVTDRDKAVFGSWHHGYRLDSPLPHDDIRKLEETYELSLPEDYAVFLQEAGNGGAGLGYGLERFGYPITQPIYETVEQRKLAVQYFERRRMEIHPELPGSPILLGLLGREVLAQPTPATSYPDCLSQALPSLRDVDIGKPLGCPLLLPLPNVPAAWPPLLTVAKC